MAYGAFLQLPLELIHSIIISTINPVTMDLQLTEEQIAIKDAAREFADA